SSTPPSAWNATRRTGGSEHGRAAPSVSWSRAGPRRAFAARAPPRVGFRRPSAARCIPGSIRPPHPAPPRGSGRSTTSRPRPPVVSTRVGAVSEVLRDGESAVLVAPNSAAAVASAIDRLLRDEPLAARVVAHGRATVAERFSVDESVAAFLDVVHELLPAGQQ